MLFGYGLRAVSARTIRSGRCVTVTVRPRTRRRRTCDGPLASTQQATGRGRPHASGAATGDSAPQPVPGHRRPSAFAAGDAGRAGHGGGTPAHRPRKSSPSRATGHERVAGWRPEVPGAGAPPMPTPGRPGRRAARRRPRRRIPRCPAGRCTRADLAGSPSRRAATSPSGPANRCPSPIDEAAWRRRAHDRRTAARPPPRAERRGPRPAPLRPGALTDGSAPSAGHQPDSASGAARGDGPLGTP